MHIVFSGYLLSDADSKTLNKTPAKLTNFYLMTCLYQSARKIEIHDIPLSLYLMNFQLYLPFTFFFKVTRIEIAKRNLWKQNIKKSNKSRHKYYFICFLFFNNLFSVWSGINKRKFNPYTACLLCNLSNQPLLLYFSLIDELF